MNEQNFIKTKVISSLLLGLVITIPVMAEDEESGRLSRIERFELADTDGDGNLSQDERQTVRETRRENQLERFDSNDDGRLNRDEREDIRDRREDRADRYFTESY